MKRLRPLLLLSLLLLLLLPARAGDIPETLLHDENAQIFFAEVVDYHPDQAQPSISLSPLGVVKGEVQTGSLQHYQNPGPVGDFPILEGEIYLVTYFEGDNYIDLFSVTTYDTDTLRLRHVEGDMWLRFQDYLNEGAYGRAALEHRTTPPSAGTGPPPAGGLPGGRRTAAPWTALSGRTAERRRKAAFVICSPGKNTFPGFFCLYPIDTGERTVYTVHIQLRTGETRP